MSSRRPSNQFSRTHLVMEQRGNASGSPMREDDTDEDYWLTNNTTVFTQLLPMKPRVAV